jgi:hypothetical protein
MLNDACALNPGNFIHYKKAKEWTKSVTIESLDDQAKIMERRFSALAAFIKPLQAYCYH